MIEQMEKTLSPTSLPPEIPILGFDRIEFYVGNAKQAANYYTEFMGFDGLGFKGPETGSRDTVSYLLAQNNIRFVLTSALDPDHPVARHFHQHGDGVKDIGLLVEDTVSAYETAIARGAVSVKAPFTEEDEHGKIIKATIQAYGETTHTFVQRNHYYGTLEPEFESRPQPSKSIGLQQIDHMVANVEEGGMDEWVAFYQNVFGFYVLRHYDEKDISTQYSALVSKVMANKSGTIKLPINEPAKGLRKSQIQEYLDFYHSAGIQHMAIATRDIRETVQALRDHKVTLMTVPATYYEDLAKRIGDIREPLEELAKLGILADRDDGGYLLQIFTQPIQDRPTFFFEIIQREGADGFGKGNFKALFEAIERDQERRGNL